MLTAFSNQPAFVQEGGGSYPVSCSLQLWFQEGTKVLYPASTPPPLPLLGCTFPEPPISITFLAVACVYLTLCEPIQFSGRPGRKLSQQK